MRISILVVLLVTILIGGAVQLRGARGPTAILEPAFQAGTTGPDYDVRYTLTLTNTGQLTDTYHLEMEQRTDWAVWVWPYQPTLGPGSSITLSVRIRPALDAGLVGTSHVMVLTATGASRVPVAASMTTTVVRPTWWWYPGGCNRPASDAPQGAEICRQYEPIGPADHMIAPPCVRGMTWWTNDNVTDLFITVDHPELCWPYNCPGAIHLERERANPWQLTEIRTVTSCAKDEAPLAWATVNMLNTGRLDSLRMYAQPPPRPFLDRLAALGGWRWPSIFLPVVRK